MSDKSEKALAKCKAEFETLLEVSEGRLREINLLKLEVKEGISIGAGLLRRNKALRTALNKARKTK